ncbi:carboxypeptidase S1 [Plectosphaerella plurivora]|uniref:Carboxypeptidase S1 n=1 Tax=Plectosphaerella plurivora TaxID=936078 RepID=A0A9P9A9I8_9PEZI|nr:carboxypeptidase S1 [Plectosphaerella plurivora]
MKLSALISLLAIGSAAAIPSPLQPRTTCSTAGKPKVTVKKISNLCETKPGLKSYSGTVSLPATPEFPFEQNIFFWLFESRNKPKTDPLTLWINGGPGSPSIDQALGHNGPCKVNSDSKTTTNNPWSWNNRANLLYIDQPTHTGFSFDAPFPGRIDILTGKIFGPSDTPPASAILDDGKFSSQKEASLLSTSQNVARVLWTFMQAWSADSALKAYSRPSIHLWSQSYGGHYVPAIATHFEAQSATIASSPSPPLANLLCRPRPIRIASVGIISAFVDILLQAPGTLEFAHTNTYGRELLTEAQADARGAAFNAPGSCADQILACRAAIDEFDPEGYGNQPAIIAPCYTAVVVCAGAVGDPAVEAGVDPLDFTQPEGTHFPPPYAFGFLNRPNIQAQLGAKVNTTTFNNRFEGPFVISGDTLRSFVPELESLIDVSIPVHIIYGDRDFRTNWFGGEDLSLALGGPYFASAGYAPLTVSSSTAGHTRQVGKFSFTKLNGAGHEAPWYKPEASYAIYQRALDGKDIATGSTSVGSSYATSGLSNIRNIPATPPGPTPPTFCYTKRVPLVPGQCTAAQLTALRDGTAVVENFVVVSPAWTP